MLGSRIRATLTTKPWALGNREEGQKKETRKKGKPECFPFDGSGAMEPFREVSIFGPSGFEFLAPTEASLT